MDPEQCLSQEHWFNLRSCDWIKGKTMLTQWKIFKCSRRGDHMLDHHEQPDTHR